jgi:hypothetical protein
MHFPNGPDVQGASWVIGVDRPLPSHGKPDVYKHNGLRSRPQRLGKPAAIPGVGWSASLGLSSCRKLFTAQFHGEAVAL